MVDGRLRFSMVNTTERVATQSGEFLQGQVARSWRR